MTTPMTNAELQAARELCERPLVVFMTGASNWEPNEVERFYIAARTLLPKLLDEIEAMRPVVEEAERWYMARDFEPACRARHCDRKLPLAKGHAVMLSDEEIDDLETWDGNDMLEQLDVVTGHDLGHAFLSQAREANRLRAALSEALSIASSLTGYAPPHVQADRADTRIAALRKLLDSGPTTAENLEQRVVRSLKETP